MHTLGSGQILIVAPVIIHLTVGTLPKITQIVATGSRIIPLTYNDHFPPLVWDHPPIVKIRMENHALNMRGGGEK